MKSSVSGLVRQFLDERRPAAIDRPEWRALHVYLRERLPDRRLSDDYLLELLHQTELPVARSLGGLPVDLRNRVHTSEPGAAAQSLTELAAEYADSGPERRADIRRAVLRAKERLQLQLRRKDLSADKRAEKQELLIWFLTWLENPPVFDAWLAARMRSGAKPGLVE